MSKPRTHYAKPMTMGESICRVGRAVAYAFGGAGYRARVHGSTVELVGTIEETTCMLCRRVYWGTKDGNPPPGCLCLDDFEHAECPVHSSAESGAFELKAVSR